MGEETIIVKIRLEEPNEENSIEISYYDSTYYTSTVECKNEDVMVSRDCATSTHLKNITAVVKLASASYAHPLVWGYILIMLAFLW